MRVHWFAVMIALMLACAAPTQVNVLTPAQGSSPEVVAPAAAPTADQPAAPRPLERVPMAYSVLGGDALAMWVAQEEGLYQRHGIDPDLTYIGGSTRIVEAIIAGEVRIAQVGGAATVAADLAGADIVEIGSLVPVFVLSMFAQPDVASVESLRGQSIAVTTLGTSTDFGARVVVKRAGLEPLRDVALIQSGGVPESLGALTSGRVQAAVFGPPTTLLARAAGLRELVDLSTTGVAYEQAPLGTTRRYLLERPEIVRGFLRAIVESIALIKRDPALAKRLLAQYTKTDDDARLEETYHLYVDNALQRVPYPNVEGLQTVLDLLDDPRAREARPEQFLDDSYLRELEASGFIGRLYDAPR